MFPPNRETGRNRIPSQGTEANGNLPEKLSMHGAQEKLREKSGEIVRTARDAMRSSLAEGLRTSADEFSAASRVLRDGSQTLRSEEHRTAARAIDSIATFCDQASGRLGRTSADDVIDRSADFVRRHSSVVLAGSMLAGFVAARAMKGMAAQPRPVSRLQDRETDRWIQRGIES
ncbi:MAG: hypothetical protein WBX15_08150 [Thermoanaerobaculia bacterium]